MSLSLSHLPSKENVPLRVIVVPYSHVDPAWLKTFQEYYNKSISNILNHVVQFLSQYEDMTFLWSETATLARWWHSVDYDKRETLRKLIHEGRLEISGGGWVMADEAVTSLFGLIDQQITGRWWLVRPDVNLTHSSIAWNIDTFGYSSVNPLYLPKMGYRAAVINRVSWKMKQYLRSQQMVEWKWICPWRGCKNTHLFVSMLPFLSYNIKYSCGPDVSICDLFDFDHSGTSSPAPVTDENIQYLSNKLMSQLRLKSRLYQHNIILFPLGDDFRFQKPSDWNSHYTNYQRLFHYMNSHKEWKVNISFGTLSQYFQQVSVQNSSFESLHGDLFTYSDHEEQYWSGYYFSRPHLKYLIRKLEHWLRCSEIILSLTALHLSSRRDSSMSHKLNSSGLDIPRQTVALLQHHDAITGTSLNHVNKDYIKKIFEASQELKLAISKALSLHIEPRPVHSSPIDIVEEESTIYPSGGHILVLFNSNAQPTQKCFHIQVTQISVYVNAVSDNSSNGIKSNVACQVNPIFTQYGRLSATLFDVLICLSMDSLSFQMIQLNVDSESTKTAGNSKSCPLAKVFSTHSSFMPSSVWSINSWHSSPYSIWNKYINLTFHPIRMGTLLLKLLNESDEPIHLSCNMHLYDSRRGGSYIFDTMKDESYSNFHLQPITFHWEGPLYAGVRVSQSVYNQSIGLYKSPHFLEYLQKGIELNYDLDLSRADYHYDNTELLLRCQTSIKNQKSIFYTDANGMYWQRRSYVKNLPLGGNIYPMSVAAMIHDNHHRLTVVSNTPHGFTSRGDGDIQIFMQRFNQIDDQRGNFEGISEDSVAHVRHVILLEQYFSTGGSHMNSCPQVLSDLAIFHIQTLTSPFLVFQHPQEMTFLHNLAYPFQLPSQLELLNMRIFPSGEEILLLLLKRSAAQSTFHRKHDSNESSLLFTLRLSNLFDSDILSRLKRVRETTLDGLTTLREISLLNGEVTFSTPDVRALVLTI